MEGNIASALNAAKEFNFEGDDDLIGVLEDYFTSPDGQNDTSDEESEESEGEAVAGPSTFSPSPTENLDESPGKL